MTTAPPFVRKDGRQASELRGKELKLSELSQFDGSSWYAQGLTSVAVTVHGPTLAKQENYRACEIAVRVLNAFEDNPMAGGADWLSQKERRRIQANTRDAYQLEMIVTRCVEAVFLRERFPRCVLAIDVLVYHDAGSLAAVVVNAVMTALLDAGVPCRTTMAAVSLALLNTRTTVAASGSSSAPSSSSSASHATQREFLLDPTDVEEKLCIEEHHRALLEPPPPHDQDGEMPVDVRPGEKRARTDAQTKAYVTAPTTGAHSSTRSNTDVLVVERETVACGTFVFSNPNCGGGLLASHVHRVAARPLTDAKTGARAAATTTASSSSSSSSANLTIEELAEMASVAERAAPFVFDLFRQCNVPL